MRSKWFIFAILFMFAGAACTSEPAEETSEMEGIFDQEPQAADTPWDTAETQSVRGEIQEVDAEAMTLTLIKEDGSVQEFQYSQSLLVTGADGIQSLTGQQGTKATIHFEESGYQEDTGLSEAGDPANLPEAVRIEVDAESRQMPENQQSPN